MQGTRFGAALPAWSRRRVLGLLLLVALAAASGLRVPLAGALPDGPDARIVLPDGRAYVLHVPPDLRADPQDVRGRPAMVVLHGLDTGPVDMVQATGFNDLADRDGALIAYPEGVLASFNAGLCCGPAVPNEVDDVEFLTRVVTDLRRRGVGRVSVVGFSNGGMMAYRLACERPGLVDTVGVLSATLEIPRCDGRITVLHLHGDRDTAVPLEGQTYSPRLKAFLRDVSTIDDAAPGSAVTFRLLSPFGHRWTQPQDPFDASEQFWSFAEMARRD